MSIYSTSPHATTHLIARHIAQETGTPWVTDFRDPWIEEPPEPGSPDGPVYRTINRWLERDVVRRSAAVVASTAHLRDLLRDRYSGESPGKFHFIANGYDEADSPAFNPLPHEIAHACALSQPAASTPAFAIRVRCSHRLRDSSRKALCGPTNANCDSSAPANTASSFDVTSAIEAAGLAASVTFVPRVPYEQSLQELAEADLLLLFQASDDTIGLVPAKLMNTCAPENRSSRWSASARSAKSWSRRAEGGPLTRATRLRSTRDWRISWPPGAPARSPARRRARRATPFR